jgi:hypothetical protein
MEGGVLCFPHDRWEAEIETIERHVREARNKMQPPKNTPLIKKEK